LGDIQLTLKIVSNKGKRTSFELIISEVNNQLKVKRELIYYLNFALIDILILMVLFV
jgi:hypothetical protein